MRTLSGITPSGTLHIGNYFGALKQFIDTQDKFDGFYFISDYHAASGLSLTFIDVVHKIFAENQSYGGYSYAYFSVSENQVFPQPFVYQIKYKMDRY